MWWVGCGVYVAGCGVYVAGCGVYVSGEIEIKASLIPAELELSLSLVIMKQSNLGHWTTCMGIIITMG